MLPHLTLSVLLPTRFKGLRPAADPELGARPQRSPYWKLLGVLGLYGWLLIRAWFNLYMRGSTICHGADLGFGFNGLLYYLQTFEAFWGLQVGHFRDWKVSMILKASFQNWFLSRILVAGSMCQIIPVRLVRLSYFKVFISEGVSNIGLFQN